MRHAALPLILALAATAEAADANPVGYRVDATGEHLTALDAKGKPMWELTFSRRDAVLALEQQTFDLDGDGVNELLVATRKQDGRSAALLVIDGKTRKQRWRFDVPGLPVRGKDGPVTEPALIDANKVAAGKVGGKRVVAVASAFSFAFSELFVLDENGKQLGTFRNSGAISSVRVLDIGQGTLAAWGCANQFDPKDAPDFAAAMHPYFVAVWTDAALSGTCPNWPHGNPAPHPGAYVVAPLPLPLLAERAGRDNYRGEGAYAREALVEAGKSPDGKPAVRWVHPDGRELLVSPEGDVLRVVPGAGNEALLKSLGPKRKDGEAVLSKEALLIFKHNK